MSNKGNTRKRPPPTPHPAATPSPQMKHQAAMEEEELDEDIFLEETLLQYEEEDSQRRAFAERLAKWKRPALSTSYLSQSENIVFQQLEIDYVVGDSHKGLLPSSSAALLEWVLMISPVHQILEGRMREANRNNAVPKFVRRIELVQRRSIMHYQQQNSQPFLKIVVALPTMVTTCRGILDRGIQIDGLGMKSFMTYESNVLFALRFMIDCNIVGGNWIEVPHGKYKKTAENRSYCQLQFDCLHAPEGEFSKMAPFRILSFDIECAGRKGLFPEPSHDPVIQIANLVTLQGEDQPFVRNVMTLKSCSPIVGVDVMSFDTENEVLLAWKDFIREVDPDIIIGYNICKFDLPYLIQLPKESYLQLLGYTVTKKSFYLVHSYLGFVSHTFLLRPAMQRDHKLSSYSLNSVSAHFLNEQKEDVHHSIISDLQNGNSETRRRLAVYCLKDAYLPQRLLDKLMFVYNYVEMARVTGVPISFLLSRGQSIKVLSQLLRKAKQKNLVIPNVKQAGSEQGTYEGATGLNTKVAARALVLEARAGFYEKPIATLDFASLYPSIMMAYNLCYCTLVTPEDARKLNLPPECVNKTPSGEIFVKSNLQKEAKDPLVKAVLDGRQLALKISANSVYGFTGATIGQLPCLEISSSVTSYGRQMIEHTKKLVEDKFTVVGGYEHNAEVIYGDTDSVMVQFGVSSVEAAMNLGREAADFISGTFIKFEKVYYPYLLISKKRYAGLYWTNPTKFDKMDTKGIETVRRDNCLLVKNLGLTKTGDDYEVKAAHVELAERMRKRDAATAPNVGDRVPYVIIKAAKGAKPLLRIFEPILKNASKELLQGSHTRSISISTPSNSGIMKFAKKQLTCIGCKALISNSDHTLCSHCKGREAELYCKSVANVADLEELFGKLWTQCQECQGSLHQDVLCTRFSVVLSLLIASLRIGSLVLISAYLLSRDCPIFYRRKKAQKDMAEARFHVWLEMFIDEIEPKHSIGDRRQAVTDVFSEFFNISLKVFCR
ncbi:hypothetical protein DH2020_015704 [Rehmannia glutinosa]|uniref:DNA polymerase n=1 Tax=Rehmannia glutinosa TaxID=99300 RepID=A0ABR0WTK2_REHGL